MFDVTHKYKGAHMFTATVKPNGTHHVHFSAYGNLASDLLEKFLDGQRVDNEETFAEWDKSLQEAISKTGYSATHKVEDGYVYITTFQAGIGISEEDKVRQNREALREARKGLRLAVLRPELEEDLDDIEDESEDKYDG